MKINHIIIFLISAGSIIACNRSGQNISDSSDKDSVKVALEKIQFNNDTISNMYDHYIQLKDALVKSDSKSAGQAGIELAGELKNIRGCENTSLIANKIGHSNDLKQQRADFTILSSDIIAMIKHADIPSGTIFVEYCPMANEGKGGYWLASDKEIRNPYYGDAMLDCGEVKEEIKAKKL